MISLHTRSNMAIRSGLSIEVFNWMFECLHNLVTLLVSFCEEPSVGDIERVTQPMVLPMFIHVIAFDLSRYV